MDSFNNTQQYPSVRWNRQRRLPLGIHTRSARKFALRSLTLVFMLSTSAHAANNYLYVQSNNVETDQNSVIAYERHKDGSLTPHPAGPFLTRGTGVDNNTNGKLGPNDNDTPIVVSENKKRLFAVNGHSNSIAVFDIRKNGSLQHVAGSPFDSQGINPVSLAISGNVLLVANRNEDPAQLNALRGAENSSYVSFKVNKNGSLILASKTELSDGHKSTQVLVPSRNRGIVFGNDFQVDADFDGDGKVSKLFGNEPNVRGRINSFQLSANPGQLELADRQTIPETASPMPDVPTVPLGLSDHPKKDLLYVGLVTRNQLGVYRYNDMGKLSFISAVSNSGQDICWIRTNKKGTRLYAVNNLPRDAQGDEGSTITVFDISGQNAEMPVEIERVALPLPLGTFINNRNMAQPNSTAFQFAIDDRERFLYVVSQRINQTAENDINDGNLLHILKIVDGGKLSVVGSRAMGPDGVTVGSRPQGVITLDL